VRRMPLRRPYRTQRTPGARERRESGPPDGDQPGPAIDLAEVQTFMSSTAIDVAYAIDGGICPLNQHLTIVDHSDGRLTLERAGAVSLRALRAHGAVW
jgi:hypothetical protein